MGLFFDHIQVGNIQNVNFFAQLSQPCWPFIIKKDWFIIYILLHATPFILYRKNG